ncbi:MAG: uroporphyrinogen-III C-methyltransferase [Treponema sp.]|nr:uroporphyrinogen-III C-methyltransferase [Treponema sp.]
MSVALVGAGLGGKGLLTLRGADLLQTADVVLYDRMVGADILAMIPAQAEKIDVGKHAGNHPVPQEEINRLLLEKARQGLNVVRLKGGDPFVFGRGGEEMELLAENGIPFEVVPGVSSAIAGPAYAGIPVTHRDCASSVHIVTAHARDNEPLNINYNALVGAGGTLVFMMGVSAIDAICGGCIAAGMDADMSAAIIENAATNAQRTFLGTVSALPAIARANNVESPAVVIIGKVCGFSGRYDWFSKRPLHGKRVIIARGRDGASRLSDRLREMGCQVTEIPCLKIVPLTGPGCMLEKKIADLQAYTWLVFTSVVGVSIFFDYMVEKEIDIRTLHHLKIACVGIETEREINKHGIKADYCPAEYNGAALARGLVDLLKNRSGEKLCIARAKDASAGAGADLTRVLAEAGIAFDDVPVYEKIKNKDEVSKIVNTISENNIIAFTSSSAVEAVAEAAAYIDFSTIKALCIGEKTAFAARSRGMEVSVAAEATIESMIARIEENL